MRIKPKGRKIYRRKDRIAYHKKIRHDVGSALITILIAVILGFVGYSAGKPILEFLRERNFLSPPLPYSFQETESTEFSDASESETTAESPIYKN